MTNLYGGPTRAIPTDHPCTSVVVQVAVIAGSGFRDGEYETDLLSARRVRVSDANPGQHLSMEMPVGKVYIHLAPPFSLGRPIILVWLPRRAMLRGREGEEQGEPVGGAEARKGGVDREVVCHPQGHADCMATNVKTEVGGERDLEILGSAGAAPRSGETEQTRRLYAIPERICRLHGDQR